MEKYENISAYNWILKYAGYQVLKIVWDQCLKVKFGENYKDVPLSWLIGRMRQRLRSRKLGTEKLGYLEGSFSFLVKRLINKLTELGVVIKTGIDINDIKIINGYFRFS